MAISQELQLSKHNDAQLIFCCALYLFSVCSLTFVGCVSISTSRSRGRTVDTWIFSSPPLEVASPRLKCGSDRKLRKRQNSISKQLWKMITMFTNRIKISSLDFYFRGLTRIIYSRKNWEREDPARPQESPSLSNIT